MRELLKPDGTLRKILPVQKLRPDAVYVRSQFALPYTRGGKRYFYHTLTRQLWELDRPVGERLTAGEIGSSGDLTALMEGLFLVPEGKDECAFYEGLSRMMRVLKQSKGIRGYTILPTLACNARCVYCYEEGMKPVTMTPEIEEQTIQYILRTRAEGRIEIGWFGGEPLLGEAIIDRICERLRREGVDYTAGMITNASLLTEAAADKMAGPWKIRHVQVSMDGAEPDYIARKRYLAYRNTYDTVIKAVNLLAERNIPVSIRCNVDEQNFGGVPRFLSDLSERIPDRKRVQVYLAPLNAVRMGENDLVMLKKIMDAEPLIREAGFREAPFGAQGIGLRIHHCMADYGSVVIGPDGSLYSCEHCPPESRFGDVANGVTDAAARDAFCRMDRTREMCRTCPLLPVCTSFAACPVHDTHCREKHLMQFERDMELMLGDGMDVIREDTPPPVCRETTTDEI